MSEDTGARHDELPLTRRVANLMGWYPSRFIPLILICVAWATVDSWLWRGATFFLILFAFEIGGLLGFLWDHPSPGQSTARADRSAVPAAAPTNAPHETSSRADGGRAKRHRPSMSRTLGEIFAYYAGFGLLASLFDAIYLAGRHGANSPLAPNPETSQIIPILRVSGGSHGPWIWYVTPLQGLIYWLLLGPTFLFFAIGIVWLAVSKIRALRREG